MDYYEILLFSKYEFGFNFIDRYDINTFIFSQGKEPSIEYLNEWNVKLLKDNCKIKAKQLIFNCDWSVLPDVKIYNKSEFESYRETLRNLILNPVENPIFPSEPQPIWSV